MAYNKEQGRYSSQQIENYLEILKNYSANQEAGDGEALPTEDRSVRCKLCKGKQFFVKLGYNIREECGASQGHALGFYGQTEYDRFHFRKKSIYQRKYHYEIKIAQVSKRLSLNEEQKYCLFKKLMAIDKDKMEILDKRFCRKKMISIFYLIKKILEEMGNEKYKLVYLKISKQTLENYEKW